MKGFVWKDVTVWPTGGHVVYPMLAPMVQTVLADRATDALPRAESADGDMYACGKNAFIMTIRDDSGKFS